MINYIIRRLLLVIPTLFGIMLLNFAIIQVVPGGPVEQMIAQITGLKPGDFVHTIGDAHLYLNHLDQAREQISRTPLEWPTLRLNPECKTIDDFKFEDIIIEDYNHHPHIKAPISV